MLFLASKNISCSLFKRIGRRSGIRIQRLIIIGFLFIRFFHQTRYIDRKDGEHHHSQCGQYHGQHFSRHRDRIDIASYGGDIHKSPPQGRTIIVHHGVDAPFQHKEYQAGEINGSHQHGNIRGKQTRYPVGREPSHYDSQRVPSPNQWDKTYKIA